MSQIGRRRFLLGTGAVLLSSAAAAQRPGRKYRVAMMLPVSAANLSPYRAALAEQLARHGFLEGHNLEIEARTALNTSHEDRQTIRELLKGNPDAFVTGYSTVTLNAMAVAKTTPIVFTWVGDPVGEGLVKSLAAPGGRVTGVSNRFVELLAKQLELGLELVPGAKRFALLGLHDSSLAVAKTREAAAALGVNLLTFPIPVTENSVAEAASQGARCALSAVSFFDYPIHVESLIRAAREQRIPVIFPDAAAVENGALMSLGVNFLNEMRRGADLLARVLGGTNPTALPVDQAARFELVLNLNAAKAIGMTIPQSVLLRADRVIE